MKNLKFYLSVILLATTFSVAQTTKKELLSDSRFAGGLYCPYIFTNSEITNEPQGYKPFYISHYGRHGSRWVLSTSCHFVPLQILGDAEKDNKLTELGKSLLEKTKVVAKDAVDRYGDLSPLGVKEEKAIAERMYNNYPNVFSTKSGKKSFIYSRSTQVPRCILSMSAFNERLKEINPEIETLREATKKNGYLNNEAAINKDTVEILFSSFLKRNLNPDRFVNSLINDKNYIKEKVKDPVNFMYLVFSMAINLPNLDHLNITMNDIFNDDEIFTLWQASNLHMYLEVGSSAVNGKPALNSAKLLLKDFIDCADKAINNQNISADLRFGHDTYIIPLLALMDIKGMNNTEADPDKVYLAWSNFKASPMGSNLQLIFFKNEANNDIIVKFLLCEKETEVPIKTDIAPFYHWKDVREYYSRKISN